MDKVLKDQAWQAETKLLEQKGRDVAKVLPEEIAILLLDLAKQKRDAEITEGHEKPEDSKWLKSYVVALEAVRVHEGERQMRAAESKDK